VNAIQLLWLFGSAQPNGDAGIVGKNTSVVGRLTIAAESSCSRWLTRTTPSAPGALW
jgi:hypothetical protein